MKRFVSLLGTFSFFKKLSSLKRHNRPFFACQLSRISPAAVISLFPFRPQKKKIPKTLDHSSTTRNKRKRKKKTSIPACRKYRCSEEEEEGRGERIPFNLFYPHLSSLESVNMTMRWENHPPTHYYTTSTTTTTTSYHHAGNKMDGYRMGGGIYIPHICRALPHSYCHQRKGKERRRRYKKIDHSYRIGKKRQKKGGKKYTSLGRGSIIVSSK